MKLLVVFVIFAVVTYASAGPATAVYDGPVYELTPIGDDSANDDADDASNSLVRQTRVTCDLLSWESKWFSPKHTACAVKCLTKRFKGGFCSRGVCICRR